jgi:hypothetical protein
MKKLYESLSREEQEAVEQFMARTVFPLINETDRGTAVQGSGFFYRKEDQKYLITAAHVMDGLNYQNLGIPEAPIKNVRIRTFDGFDIHKPSVESLDVAVIHLGPGEFVDEVVSNWNILDHRNVDLGSIIPSSEFLVSGFPMENVGIEGNKLVPKSLFQFYTYTYEGEVDGGWDGRDFFICHKRVAANSDNEEIQMVALGGLSGSPVWRLEGGTSGIWSPEKFLRLAGIQVSYKPNSYIRCKTWSLVNEIFSKLERGNA